MTTPEQEIEFHEVVAKVEERFRAELDAEARARLGAIPGSGGGTEGKYEPKMVSTGWWVILARFGIAMRFGKLKPDVVAGDTLVLVVRKIPRPQDPPALAAVPDAPRPPDFTPAELAVIRRLASTDPDSPEAVAIAAKIKEPT